MQVVQNHTEALQCHRQALVDSMARGNDIAAQELRLLLGMERELPPQGHRGDKR